MPLIFISIRHDMWMMGSERHCILAAADVPVWSKTVNDPSPECSRVNCRTCQHAYLSRILLHPLFFTFQVVLCSYHCSQNLQSIPIFSRSEQSTRIWDIERYTWFNGELCCSPTLMTFEGVFSRLVMSSTLCWLSVIHPPIPHSQSQTHESNDLTICVNVFGGK